MRYPYLCIHCDKKSEVEKTLEEIDRSEFCGGCGDKMIRVISPHIAFQGEKVEQNQSYWHPTLGCLVKSEADAKRIAKSRGLIEVGNDKQDTLAPEYKDYNLTRRDIDDVFGIGEIRGGR